MALPLDTENSAHPPSATSLADMAARAQGWMEGVSFPFWAQRACAPAGGFAERVALDGTAIDDAISRVRLQARQILCFAYARTRGFDAAICDDMVATGLEVLRAQCQRGDGLLGSTVQLGRGLADDRANLYDTAFGLAACAFAVQAGYADARPLGAAISKAIDTHLAHPDGGFQELLPAPPSRLQNPHMHLLEASMAWHRATGDDLAKARAGSIVALCEAHFVDPQTGWLSEAFNADWSPAQDNRHEIGHFYEWVWLLDLHAQMTGKALSPVARPLYEAALTLTHEDGRIALTHGADGAVQDEIYRTWGQTEALKAHLVAHRRGWPGAGAAAAKTFERMWADHIAPAVPGGWIDRVDRHGARACDDMTAATGYHIYLALDDLIAAAKA